MIGGRRLAWPSALPRTLAPLTRSQVASKGLPIGALSFFLRKFLAIFCSHSQQGDAAMHNIRVHWKVKRLWTSCFVHRASASGMMCGLRAQIEKSRKIPNAFRTRLLATQARAPCGPDRRRNTLTIEPFRFRRSAMAYSHILIGASAVPRSPSSAASRRPIFISRSPAASTISPRCRATPCFSAWSIRCSAFF